MTKSGSGEDNLSTSRRGQRSRVFFRAHREKRSAVTTAESGGYMVVVHNIYVVPPRVPSVEHKKAIDSLHYISQCMKYQRYEMDGLAQEKSVLASANTAVMEKIAQHVSMMGYTQEQMKEMNMNTKLNMKYHCWRCVRNLNRVTVSTPTISQVTKTTIITET